MVESTSPPPVVAYFGLDPAKWPHPATIAAQQAANLMDSQSAEFLDALPQTRGERIVDRMTKFNDDLERGEPIPVSTVTRQPDGSHTRSEGLLSDVIEPPPLKDFTLTVEVRRHADGGIGRATEELTAVDIADKPGLVRLAGTLGDAAYENLEKTD